MAQKYDLQALSLEELHLLLEHVRLGLAHLKAHLTKDQLDELLNLIPIDDEKEKELDVDTREESSQFFIMANYGFGGFVGFWVSVSTILHYELERTFFTLGFFALVYAASMGIISLWLKKQEAEDSLNNYKLQRLHYEIMKILTMKADQCIKKQTEELDQNNQRLMQNGVNTANIPFVLEDKEKIRTWFKNLSTFVKVIVDRLSGHLSCPSAYERINSILASIKNKLCREGELIGDLSYALKEKNPNAQEVRPSYYVLDLLINPLLTVPKKKIEVVPWYIAYKLEILNILAFTLIGGFGSFFMWCENVNKLADKFQMGYVQQFTLSSEFGIIHLILAILTGIYFSFLMIYSKRKPIIRQQENELLMEKALNKDPSLVSKKEHLELLRFLNQQQSALRDIIDILKEMEKR
jgi:hypothetical protein